MHVEQCPVCRKWVAHKPILGTLHLCLPADERALIDDPAAAQMHAVRPAPPSLFKIFGP